MTTPAPGSPHCPDSAPPNVTIDGQYVIDGPAGSLLGTINDPGGNSVLLPSGSTGWLLETQALVRLKITRFLTGTAIKLPQPVNGGAQLALSPSDRIVVAETVGGATIVEL